MFEKSSLMVPAMMVMILLLAFAVSAQSDVPHQFYGSVTVNGAPAADGTMVIAKVGTVQVAATTTSGGQYNILVPDPYRDREGKTVDFYVSGVKGGSYVFVNGGVTELNLAVTVSSPPSGGPSGGPSGAPSGPVVIGDGEEEPEETEGCIENWECSDWLECYAGTQSRVCTDLNGCGTEDDKPAEEQECSVKVCTAADQRCDGDDIVVCAQNEESWVLVKTCEDGCQDGLCSSEIGITGLVGALPAIGGIIVIIIIAAGLVYWKKR